MLVVLPAEPVAWPAAAAPAADRGFDLETIEAAAADFVWDPDARILADGSARPFPILGSDFMNVTGIPGDPLV